MSSSRRVAVDAHLDYGLVTWYRLILYGQDIRMMSRPTNPAVPNDLKAR